MTTLEATQPLVNLEATQPLVNTDCTISDTVVENASLRYKAFWGWGTGLSIAAPNWEAFLPAIDKGDAMEYIIGQRPWWLSNDPMPAGCVLVSVRGTTVGIFQAKAPSPPKSNTLDPVAIADRLQEWLGLTIDDLAAIADISKTTIHYWHREHGKPRPATVRRLLRAYALVQALIVRRGVEGTATWLRSGHPSPLELLKAGDFEAVEDNASSVLFSATSRQPDYAAYVAEDINEDAPSIAAPTAPLRRASRPPRRGRLAQ